MVMLDIAKAFEAVEHSKVAKKARDMGFSVPVLRLLLNL